MKTLKEQVYDEIKNLILLGKLKPGERISYDKLAENLGVSLIPLREVMNLLEAEGLIKIKSRKGAFIKNLKESDIDEIYYLREILETIVIKEAIKNIKEEQLEKLKDLDIKIKESEKDHNLHLLFIQNKDFHLYLYNIANKSFLLKLIKQLWTWTAPYRTIYYNRSKERDFSRDLHSIIIKACEDKIPKIAVEAMKKHFEIAKLELKKILRTFKEEDINE